MLFLQHHPAAVDTLLRAHARHMSSPQHAAEVQRSRRVDESDVQAVEDKRHQMQLKCQVERIRSQRRQMMAMHRNITAGEISAPPKRQAELYPKWKHKLAKLDARLDEATAKQGYGRTSTGHLQAPRANRSVDADP